MISRHKEYSPDVRPPIFITTFLFVFTYHLLSSSLKEDHSPHLTDGGWVGLMLTDGGWVQLKLTDSRWVQLKLTDSRWVLLMLTDGGWVGLP